MSKLPKDPQKAKVAREKAALWHHENYLKNREKFRAYYKRYRTEKKERRRQGEVMSRYGIGPEQVAKILVHQGGGCAICKHVFDGVGKQGMPHIDHDHQGGEIRGILCNNCNRSIGGFKDNPDTLRAAIEYLANPPARAILGLLPTQLKLVDESA